MFRIISNLVCFVAVVCVAMPASSYIKCNPELLDGGPRQTCERQTESNCERFYIVTSGGNDRRNCVLFPDRNDLNKQHCASDYLENQCEL